MSGSSITFRCGECNRLLGVSRSRIGSTVTCPKCGIELIVPDPDTTEASPPPGEAESASVSGEAAAVGVTGAGGAAVFPGLAIEIEPLSLRPREPQRPYKVPDRRPAPEAVPAGSSGSGFVGIQVEESPIRESVRPVTAPETRIGTRPGDVVLPRTAFLLWSFVMLAALVMTFGAGLLAGHFLWPSQAPGAPSATPSSALTPAKVSQNP